MQMKYYSSGNMSIARTLNNIAHIQTNGKENDSDALDFYRQALTMIETYYPSYHAHITMTLNYIGNILSEQGKNNEALNFYHRALKLQEDYYSSDHIELTSALINIGHILSNQGKHDEALFFYQRSLAIKQNNYQANIIDIFISFNSMGNLLLKKKNLMKLFNFMNKH